MTCKGWMQKSGHSRHYDMQLKVWMDKGGHCDVEMKGWMEKGHCYVQIKRVDG